METGRRTRTTFAGRAGEGTYIIDRQYMLDENPLLSVVECRFLDELCRLIYLGLQDSPSALMLAKRLGEPTYLQYTEDHSGRKSSSIVRFFLTGCAEGSANVLCSQDQYPKLYMEEFFREEDLEWSAAKAAQQQLETFIAKQGAQEEAAERQLSKLQLDELTCRLTPGVSAETLEAACDNVRQFRDQQAAAKAAAVREHLEKQVEFGHYKIILLASRAIERLSVCERNRLNSLACRNRHMHDVVFATLHQLKHYFYNLRFGCAVSRSQHLVEILEWLKTKRDFLSHGGELQAIIDDINQPMPQVGLAAVVMQVGDHLGGLEHVLEQSSSCLVHLCSLLEVPGVQPGGVAECAQRVAEANLFSIRGIMKDILLSQGSLSGLIEGGIVFYKSQCGLNQSFDVNFREHFLKVIVLQCLLHQSINFLAGGGDPKQVFDENGLWAAKDGKSMSEEYMAVLERVWLVAEELKRRLGRLESDIMAPVMVHVAQSLQSHNEALDGGDNSQLSGEQLQWMKRMTAFQQNNQDQQGFLKLLDKVQFIVDHAMVALDEFIKRTTPFIAEDDSPHVATLDKLDVLRGQLDAQLAAIEISTSEVELERATQQGATNAPRKSLIFP